MEERTNDDMMNFDHCTLKINVPDKYKLECPNMIFRQKSIVFTFFAIIIFLIFETSTGQFFSLASSFVSATDGASTLSITLILVFSICIAGTLLGSSALVSLFSGYLYGRRIKNGALALTISSTVVFAGLSMGYLA